jgi:hypothetical protein
MDTFRKMSKKSHSWGNSEKKFKNVEENRFITYTYVVYQFIRQLNTILHLIVTKAR